MHQPITIPSLNLQAFELLEEALTRAERLRILPTRLANGATLVDFGIDQRGGIEAGLVLARICMAELATVDLTPWKGEGDSRSAIQVVTDSPVNACMASQYAGWPVQGEKFFAMGSGSMRVKRGKEPVLESLAIYDPSDVAVGVLECDKFPDDSITAAIADACRISPDKLFLCIAPTRSLAGTIQVVARSVETSLHKLYELGFDLSQVISGTGLAPLPPPAIDFAEGIGRTNDAILYGGHVTLWVDSEDRKIEEIGPKVPSCNSPDFGQPFAETFKGYDYDFYKVDPGLFSPAMLTVVNLNTGKSWRWGSLRSDILDKSFGTH